ncbi:MAG: DnaJ domain-containing protein [Armatimonadota bacterium]|nr:DnaJ domain-containing protein [Armatimonadota bacterium]MDR5702555.1 DnaJ domain-containing protein [Armatimonadota bacterium]MDR7434455.1 DnaJ domain-containing protein [Armatimonadota bacterium]
MEKDYYQILGVDPNASQEEIREAYRFKVFALHPDRFPQSDPKIRRRAEEELKAINEAYAVLGDPRRRAEYNQHRAQSKERFSSTHTDEARPRSGGVWIFPPVLVQKFLSWGLLVLLLIYLLSPIDLVPDALVGPGWVDDLLALLVYLLYTRGRPFFQAR